MAITRLEPTLRKSYPFWRHLTTTGDGTGDEDMTGNYAPETPGVFSVVCQPDEYLQMHWMSMQLQDAGKFDADKFGGLATLSNGVLLYIYNDITDAEPIHAITEHPLTQNGHLLHYSPGNIVVGDTGETVIAVKLSFTDAPTEPYKLYPGQGIVAILRDNLTGLSVFHMMLHGRRVTNEPYQGA